MRQIVLDTETTGLSPEQGHRLIEVAAVELVQRKRTGRHLHYLLDPEREIDAEATRVHGKTWADLKGAPRFAEVADELLAFLQGAELIIHNASFDVGFLDSEYLRLDVRHPGLASCCRITDTLAMARELHPGQRNTLDALVKRYAVEERDRSFHGALLDAEILLDVYLAMTGGQVGLAFGSGTASAVAGGAEHEVPRPLPADRGPLPVWPASATELARHEQSLQAIARESRRPPLWTMSGGDRR